MNILVKEKNIYAVAPKIELGVYDEPFEKWALYDEDDKLLYYMVDDEFTLLEGIELPVNYEDGRYFYKDGEFVLNEDWKPYYSVEEQLDMLQKENDDRIECEAEILYELSLLQLGLI